MTGLGSIPGVGTVNQAVHPSGIDKLLALVDSRVTSVEDRGCKRQACSRDPAFRDRDLCIQDRDVQILSRDETETSNSRDETETRPYHVSRPRAQHRYADIAGRK